MAAPPPAVTAPAQPEAFYQKPWFWAVAGVVVLTATFLLVVAATSSSTPKPNTVLGDMRAF
jgi:hypothetical protein